MSFGSELFVSSDSEDQFCWPQGANHFGVSVNCVFVVFGLEMDDRQSLNRLSSRSFWNNQTPKPRLFLRTLTTTSSYEACDGLRFKNLVKGKYEKHFEAWKFLWGASLAWDSNHITANCLNNWEFWRSQENEGWSQSVTQIVGTYNVVTVTLNVNKTWTLTFWWSCLRKISPHWPSSGQGESYG